uniref:Uncharacterized protein n=1 Tax=Arundo donax TaxID=35708 RepID=A0A0A9BQR2_ARUDO
MIGDSQDSWFTAEYCAASHNLKQVQTSQTSRKRQQRTIERKRRLA